MGQTIEVDMKIASGLFPEKNLARLPLANAIEGTVAILWTEFRRSAAGRSRTCLFGRILFFLPNGLPLNHRTESICQVLICFQTGVLFSQDNTHLCG